ncbi:MAG TPA: hypothetical protein VII01_00235 [Solirubrobacteraceae bacterium]|jgi:hypothetical protein
MPSAPDASAPCSPQARRKPCQDPEKVSDQLERWLSGDGRKTVGSLIELFGEKSFATLFVVLVVLVALLLGAAGVILEIVLGTAAVHGIGSLL